MKTKLRALGVTWMLALVAGLGCDPGGGPPLGPTPQPRITALSLSGKTSLAPGETTRLTAKAQYSDNTEQDVTDKVVWECYSSQPGEVTDIVKVLSAGAIEAVQAGRATVAISLTTAPYGLDGPSTSVPVRVAPEGSYLLDVVVGDGNPVAGAIVRVDSAAGAFSATTDHRGTVTLPGLGATKVQVQKDGYVAIAESMTITEDTSVSYTLKR